MPDEQKERRNNLRRKKEHLDYLLSEKCQRRRQEGQNQSVIGAVLGVIGLGALVYFLRDETKSVAILLLVAISLTMGAWILGLLASNHELREHLELMRAKDEYEKSLGKIDSES